MPSSLVSSFWEASASASPPVQAPSTPCFNPEASYAEMISLFNYEGVSVPGLNDVVAFENEMNSVSDGIGPGHGQLPSGVPWCFELAAG